MFDATHASTADDLPEPRKASIGARRSETSYRRGLTYLMSYIAEHGTAEMPRVYRAPDGFRLGIWVSTQRRCWRQGNMPAARIAALEAIPGWAWRTRSTPATCVEDHIWRLEAYAKRKGHARVPALFVDEDGFCLGSWLSKVRERRHDFTPEERAKFEALPGWMWDVFKEKFALFFGALEAYVARFGNARIPRDYVDDAGIRLGVWVLHRRARRDKYDPAENAKLEALPGWQWSCRDVRFDVMMEALEAHVEEFGHADVPQSYKSGKMHLGAMVRRYRSRKAELDPETIAALEALPGWTWEIRDLRAENFTDGIERLLRFEAEHGHTRVPRLYRDPDGFWLGTWVGKRRRGWRTMPAERRAALERFKDWYWANG